MPGMVRDFSFSHPTKVVFGCGAVKALGSLVSDLGHFRNVLVVTDRALARHPVVQKAVESLRGSGLRCEVFREVEPNPADTVVHQGADVVRTADIDVLVAVGGGSSIDAAKGMSIVAKYGGSIQDYEPPDSVPGPGYPVVAVPTTAGTGSEVTQWAVITDTRTHRKMALGSPHLIPALAVLDPAVTTSLPPELTAYTGLDALTHALEAYTATVAHPVADAFCLQAVRLISENLRAAVSNGEDLGARSSMVLAALFGGYAINFSDVAGVHCLAEALGSKYSVPHGLACAVFLVPVTEYNLAAALDRYTHVATALGADREDKKDEATARAGLDLLKQLCTDLRVPSLSELGVRKEDLGEIAALAARNVSVPSNPRPVDEQAFLEILLASY